MTKQVRIENADTSNHPVRVTVQHLNTATGQWEDQPGAVQLDHPTAMTAGLIHSHQRLVVSEQPAD